MNTNNKIGNLGMFMRIAVGGAIEIAQAEAAHYQRIPKVHYDGMQEDLVTSADLKVQEHYQLLVKNHYPNDPLVGEEGEDKDEVTGRRFTCDPVDGTKAYGRNQSTGVSTMFAHVDDEEEVNAVCLGDINTGEIYQYAPDLSPIRTRFGITSFLGMEWNKPLGKQYVLLRHPLDEFPKNVQKMVRAERGGLFKDMEVTSGSIGLTISRLWKQEVAMVIIEKSYETPWDTTPLIGMNKVLGITYIKVDPVTGKAEATDAFAPTKVYKRDCVLIMVHHTYQQKVIDWLNQHAEA
ncbi:MAG: inositol monophosphatase family protein [Nitrospira sp.]